MTIISRRAVLGGLAAAPLVAPSILSAQQLFAVNPFRLGIASGDPSPDGFVIWTRLCPEPLDPQGGMPMMPVEVDWAVGTDEELRTVVQKGKVLARPELAHAVHVEVAGLEPDRPYWYRFTIGREKTVIGRARTAPCPGSPLTALRFAAAGCQAYDDGLYTAYRHLADEELHFVFHYGDYIYENRGAPIRITREGQALPFVRRAIGGPCFSLDDYRRRYAQGKMDEDLQRAHAAHSWFVTMDDHEVENNWVSDLSEFDVPAELFRTRRAMAWQAWYEHMPVRRTSLPTATGVQIYRRARFGDLLDAHFLDTRQYRSDQPCGDGFEPDCGDIDKPGAQVLGPQQERWLAAGLHDQTARWNLIAQQVMVMRLDRRTRPDEAKPIANMDSWAGYLAPRERFLQALKDAGNAVVVTGDEHQSFAGELETRDGTPAAVEFVATSISSGGSGADLRPEAARIRANNPFLRYSNDRRGYLLCEVARDLWRSHVRTIDTVDRPDGRIATAATLAVEHGRPRLQL